MSLPVLSGTWVNSNYIVFSDDGDVIIYYLQTSDLTIHTTYGIKYTRSTLTWSDQGISVPHLYNSVDDHSTATATVVNPVKLFGFAGAEKFLEVNNPHWQAPPNTNSVSDAFVSYVVEDNELRVYIPLDKPSTVGTDVYYQLRKVSGTSFFVRIVHTQGTATNETIVPTTAGIYQFEKVQSSPYISTTYGTAEVTQAQLDFYATNNPPENDPPPTPVFVPRSARRGNLNFW